MSGAKIDDRGVITVCTACGQKNRTIFERLGQTGQCGRCQAEIPPPAMPIEVDSVAHFDALLQRSALPMLIDYWAPWCGPCRMVAPELEKVALSSSGRFLVVKVNTEALPALGQRYRIQSIPTMAVFVGGREVAQIQGARPAAAIENFVRNALAA